MVPYRFTLSGMQPYLQGPSQDLEASLPKVAIVGYLGVLQGPSQDLEASLPKLAIVRYVGALFF